MPTADFEPTKQVLLVFLDVVGRGRLGSVFVFVFPFLWFCVGDSVCGILKHQFKRTYAPQYS